MASVQIVFRSFGDVILDVLQFPVWWYSRGLVRFFSYCEKNIAGTARSLSLKVWMKNLFVPMYGHYDWQSRIISVFMRTVQIIGRLIAFVVWGVIILLGFVLYLAAPILFGVLALYYGVGSFVK